MRQLIAGALTALALVASRAEAQIIYNNGTPDGATGLGANGNEFTAWVQAENFTLSSAATVGGIRFWAQSRGGDLTSDPFAGSIFWAIATANPGNTAPSSIIASGEQAGARVLLGPNDIGSRTWRHDLTVNVPLSSGNYFLLLHNGPLTRFSSDGYFWATTAPTVANAPAGRECISGMSGFPTPLTSCSWNSNSAEHAFQLFAPTSTVPEPETYALLATGLAAMAVVARRRGRR